MRRLGLVMIVVAVAGCSALRDAFSAHPTDAATAAGQVLTVDRLAALAAKVKGMPLQPENVGRLADVYIDYTLFALALAQGRTLTDSATIAATMWPLASQLKWDHFHDRLTTGRIRFSPRQVDSAFEAGTVRVFQHILLQVPPSAAPAAARQKEIQAKGLLTQITAAHGANFVALAKRYSDDPGTKNRGGMLNATGRGQFVPQFEQAAWQLAPGGVSSVVRTPYGFHIIRRPPLAEVRDSFAQGLQDVLSTRLDSTYMASLDTARQIRLTGGAGAAVRQAIQDLTAARTDGHILVTYRGGSFKVKDLIRWIRALPPEVTQAVPTATDAQIGLLLRQLTERNILLQQADSARVQLTDSDWTDLRAAHDSALRKVQGALALTSQTLKDSATTREDRVRLAMSHVQGYLDNIVVARSNYVQIPPFLGDVLRAGAPWSVNQAGLVRASERARELRAQSDSLRGAPQPNNEPAPRVRPAPGPAPVPGRPPRTR
ncbi:MAG: hypothetical protein AUH42_03165 [Gemmatimonadetes bacterium 13_1_40CM_70_11]|nr:MAG: hypothetical protein AUH42_03165 [Gemmatimonadetes bacterium 13_1_40CM_70_11]